MKLGMQSYSFGNEKDLHRNSLRWSVRRIEHGRANPTINELWRIAEVLEVELRNPFALPVAMGTLS